MPYSTAAPAQAAMPLAGLTPCSPGLKSALPQHRPTTPARPMTRPSMRDGPGLSRSQPQATSAAQIGAVALKTAIKPVVSANAPSVNKANGSAEFSRPATAMARQCWRSAVTSPRHTSSGSRTRVAPPTRTNTKASGPKSAAPARMNKNEAPHTAASSSNSARSRRAMFMACVFCDGYSGDGHSDDDHSCAGDSCSAVHAVLFMR